MKAPRKQKKSLIIILTLLVLALAGFVTFAYATKSVWPFYASNDQSQTSSSTNQHGSSSSINYAPPTQQEIDNSQDGKKNSANQPGSTTPDDPQTNKKSVSVAISYADRSDDKTSIEVRAFTPDVIEGDGTCTARFTKDGQTVTGSSKGFVDATSTICQPINIPLAQFGSSGRWALTVTYSSPDYSGTSSSLDVGVQK